MTPGIVGRDGRAGHRAQRLGPGGRGFLPGTSAGELARLARKEMDGKTAGKYLAAYHRKAGRSFSEIAETVLGTHAAARNWLAAITRPGGRPAAQEPRQAQNDPPCRPPQPDHRRPQGTAGVRCKANVWLPPPCVDLLASAGGSRCPATRPTHGRSDCATGISRTGTARTLHARGADPRRAGRSEWGVKSHGAPWSRKSACAQVHRPLTPDDACNATLLPSERRRTPLQVL